MVAAALALWFERRLVVREWDCFCLGTAITEESSRPSTTLQSNLISESFAQRGSTSAS